MLNTTIELLRRRTRAKARAGNTVEALTRDIDRHGGARRAALRDRIAAVIDVLGDDTTRSGRTDTAGLLGGLIDLLTPLTADRAWLMLATISATLPDSEKVRAAVRAAEEEGAVAAIRLAIWSGPLPRVLDGGPFRTVRILVEATLVDVQHTAETDFATGIQRVTREVTRRWVADHDIVAVGWTKELSAFRLLSPAEVDRACWGGPAVIVPDDQPVVVPWHGTYVLPELAAEPERTGPLLALAQYSGTTMNTIGYDLVPVTTAETAQAGMLISFARYLSAGRHARTIAPISEAAGEEYRGWRDMLVSTGLPGPAITPVRLPGEAPPDEPHETEQAARRLRIGEFPLVLVVGSHEPRKNHLAVLHAAELLWREGHKFSLTFIGGNAWNSEDFAENLDRLQRAGRPIESIAAASDGLLFGGYRTARFTLFPSLNEGFGLPVAESLACGTPVVTSAFGSMREIVEDGGGGLLVDPRDDHDIAAAMRSLLTDDDLHARLCAEAAQRPVRTWDSYAAEVWAVLTTPADAPASPGEPAAPAELKAGGDE